MRAGPLSRKSHAILSQAPNKDLGKEFLDFLMQPEYLLPFLRTVPVPSHAAAGVVPRQPPVHG